MNGDLKLFERKHESIVRARGMVQQKMLQILLDKHFIYPILATGEDCFEVKESRVDMSIEDAIALERYVSTSKLACQLSVEGKARPPAFFFDQSSP